MTHSKLTQLSSLDADDIGQPLLVIERFHPDFHSLGEDVDRRVAVERQMHPTGCVFLNPLVTIRAKSPGPAFFRAVKKYQAQWCRRRRYTRMLWTGCD